MFGFISGVSAIRQLLRCKTAGLLVRQSVTLKGATSRTTAVACKHSLVQSIGLTANSVRGTASQASLKVAANPTASSLRHARHRWVLKLTTGTLAAGGLTTFYLLSGAIPVEFNNPGRRHGV